MARRAFVFSLDAFVAFSLVLIAIQSMLVLSSMPRGYYPGLLQAELLAKDTLQSLSLARLSASQSVLGAASEDVLRGRRNTALIEATDRLIPPPYSYAYYYYNFSNKQWIKLYNASEDSLSGDIHYGVRYRRVQASAQTLMMGYAAPLVAGGSPYCNVVCRGFDRTRYDPSSNPNAETPAGSCVQVPCNVSVGSTYDPGDFNVGVMRLLVWG